MPPQVRKSRAISGRGGWNPKGTASDEMQSRVEAFDDGVGTLRLDVGEDAGEVATHRAS